AAPNPARSAARHRSPILPKIAQRFGKRWETRCRAARSHASIPRNFRRLCGSRAVPGVSYAGITWLRSAGHDRTIAMRTKLGALAALLVLAAGTSAFAGTPAAGFAD